MNCRNRPFEEMTPLERKSSLEFRIAEFDPLRLMDNEMSCGKFIISLEGDDDLGYRLALYMKPINKYGDSDKRVVTHEHVAQKCNVNPLIMGGAEVRYNMSTLLFFGFSFDFGAIPEEVMNNFLPYLKNHIRNFDYERSDRVIQEEKSSNEQEYWKEQCEQVKTEQRIVEEQLRKRESAIKEKIGWWNKRKAEKKGITVEQYIAEEYAAELPALREMPHIPEKPVFQFKKRDYSSCRNTEIKLNLDYGFSLPVCAYINDSKDITGLEKWQRIGYLLDY